MHDVARLVADAADRFTRALDELTTSGGPRIGELARARDTLLALAAGEPPEAIIEWDERMRRLWGPFGPTYRWTGNGRRSGGKTRALQAMQRKLAP